MQIQISKSQFKAKALEYLREVEKQKKPLVITHAGKPMAKVVPFKEEDQDNAILESLRGSVLKYEEPDDPAIDPKEWEALK
jgi:prevent-host-death family protein